MARQTVVVSDMSGKMVESGQGAKVRITYEDARRGVVELDTTADEVADLAAKGRKTARRGRRPKSETG